MKARKCLPVVLSTLCAAALLVAPAAASAAGTIATGRACYVAQDGEGVKIDVKGSGFTPGEAVLAQVPAPGGLAGFAETTVGPDGTIATAVAHVFPESVDPIAEKRTIQIKSIASGLILAEVRFRIANLAVKTEPAVAPYRRVVRYVFAGFRPHRPIFGHYFRRGRLAVTHRFGVAKGPCGILRTRARLFPGNGPRRARYKVQFDDSRRVDRQAIPRIVTTLGVAFRAARATF